VAGFGEIGQVPAAMARVLRSEKAGFTPEYAYRVGRVQPAILNLSRRVPLRCTRSTTLITVGRMMIVGVVVTA
jgi:hypothetical protein